jgi:hypothetical protein
MLVAMCVIPRMIAGALRQRSRYVPNERRDVKRSNRFGSTKSSVHHLDVAGHGDVAGGDLARAGGRKLQPLGAFAFHLERDLLHVEDEVGSARPAGRSLPPRKRGSSRTPARLENSCSTVSILIEVIAAPCRRVMELASRDQSPR